MMRRLLYTFRFWRDPALAFTWRRAWRTARRYS